MHLNDQRTSIRAPEDADNGNILEKDKVERELMTTFIKSEMEIRMIRVTFPLQQERVRVHTCSIAPPVKPTTSARPPHAMHLSASTEPINIRVYLHHFPLLSGGHEPLIFPTGS